MIIRRHGREALAAVGFCGFQSQVTWILAISSLHSHLGTPLGKASYDVDIA